MIDAGFKRGPMSIQDPGDRYTIGLEELYESGVDRSASASIEGELPFSSPFQLRELTNQSRGLQHF